MQEDPSSVLISAGKFIGDNSDFLSESIYLLRNLDKQVNNVVAVIDDVILSDSEYQFRKGFYEATGLKSSDDNTVFNTLVEEKMLLSYASKNNLLPSESEVTTFIEQEKIFYNEDAVTKRAIDTLCSAANISIDEYWNTYEYYNAYRCVAFKKIFDEVISQGVKENKVRVLKINDKSIYNPEIVEEQYAYYNQFKKDLKAKVNIKVKEPYSSRSLTMDSSKLYL